MVTSTRFPPSRSRRHFIAGVTALSVAGMQVPASAQAAPLKIVATTGMIADAARTIGGNLVEVTALMGAGVDPHSYRQTRSDIAAMTGADLVLWHGLGLEAQLERFLGDLARRRPVVAVAEAIPEHQLLRDPEFKDKADPHVWMDPDLWKVVAGAVITSIVKARPAQEARHKASAAAFLADIDRLSAYSRKILATVPAERRLLVTAHDAFNYFARAYAFEVMGIQGVSTESEAGLQRIRELVDTIVSRKIGAIFVESSVSDRNIRALIEGASARGHTVRIGAELFSDAPGPSGSYEGSYIGMIDHNVTSITRALGGEAPSRGMNDRLATTG